MSNKNQEILELYKSKVMPTYEPSLVIAGGKGITVRDVDGMSYYDFTSGIGVHNVGYGNKKVIGFLVGQCMKAAKGSGNPKLFNQLLVQKLG